MLAKEHGIPFYMRTDFNDRSQYADRQQYQIELRSGEEISRMWYREPMAPKGIKTYNPAFDVTPARYITAVITEKGIVKPPYEENLPKLFAKKK